MKVAVEDLKKGDRITVERAGRESATFTFHKVGKYHTHDQATYLYGTGYVEVRCPDMHDIYRHDPIEASDLKKGDRVLVVLDDGTEVDTTVYFPYGGLNGFDTEHNSYAMGGNGVKKLYLLDRAAPPTLVEVINAAPVGVANIAAAIEKHFTVVPK